MKKIFLTFILFSSMLSLHAQFILRGTVKNVDGEALIGASVLITEQSSGMITDIHGRFEFTNIKKNTCTVRISYIGYENIETSLSLPLDTVFVMHPKVIPMEAVVITATRANDKSPVAYTNVRKEELSKNNFAQDVPTLLNFTPSYVSTSDAGNGVGYSGFRIRGTDANRINVSANGIPLNDPESQSVFWVNMPDIASSVEDIQIQRGVGTSTNGAGAFGANINMQTQGLRSKPYADLSATYGSFNTYKGAVNAGTGLMNEHWAFDMRLSNIHSDGYIDRASTDLFSFYAQGGYYSNKGIIKLLMFSGDEKTYHAWDGVPKEMLSTNRTYNSCGFMGVDSSGKDMFYENQTDNYHQNNYQLHFIKPINDYWQANVALHYTKGEGYYEEYKIDQKLVKYGLTPFYTVDSTLVKATDLVRQKWMDNYFIGGVFSANYQQGDLALTFGGAVNKYFGDHFGKVIWVKNYVGDLNPDRKYYQNEGDKADQNIYVKGNYQMNKAWNIYGDMQLRHVHYEINGSNDTWNANNESMQELAIDKHFTFFNPKVGLSFQPKKQHQFFASFAIANREPNRNNYTDAKLNENPTFETLYDGEAGYKFQNQRFGLGLNIYAMYYHNQLILTGEVNELGEALTSNIPESYRTGVELMGQVKILKNLSWQGNITVSDNQIINFTEYADDWVDGGQIATELGNTPIAFSPSTILNSIFTYNYRNFEAAFQSSYVGKQYLDNTGNEDRLLDPYFVNNFRLDYIFRPKNIKEMRIGLMVNNIFNEYYESNGWSYSYYDLVNGEKVQQNMSSYFPQATINFLVNFAVKF